MSHDDETTRHLSHREPSALTPEAKEEVRELVMQALQEGLQAGLAPLTERLNSMGLQMGELAGEMKKTRRSNPHGPLDDEQWSEADQAWQEVKGGAQTPGPVGQVSATGDGENLTDPEAAGNPRLDRPGSSFLG